MNNKLIQKFAERFSVDQTKVVEILKATAFKQKAGSAPVTDEQMMALLIVADQYGLNPFTREIYAFPDKQNGIVPVVGVDGWSRIINQHPDFDGMEFRPSDNLVEIAGAKPCPEWMECLMYRKDRAHPTAIREYLDEVYREPFTGTKDGRSYTVPGPWQTHTKRFLRHKTMIQAARLVFGFVGIYDQDEAERILEGQSEVVASGTELAPYPSGEPSQEAQRKTRQLIARAEKAGTWQAALDYAGEHFSGPDLAYVTHEITKARKARQAGDPRPAQADPPVLPGKEAPAEAKEALHDEPVEA
jgi:phage recombination protein Bet